MYAGGKTRLLKHYEPILPNLDGYDNYVEPFFGAGAVYCYVVNQNNDLDLFINDVNKPLMEIYERIKNDKSSFVKTITEYFNDYLSNDSLEDRKIWYYSFRKLYWDNPDPEKLYVLLKTSFNGVWQTCKDSKGLFGTPAGLLNHSDIAKLCNLDNIDNWSLSLNNTTVTDVSYKDIKIPEGKNLIYCDPPYRDSFTNYGTGFDDKDQNDLIAWCNNLASDGNKVLLANRVVEEDDFFESKMTDFDFHYFPVKYTAGRRKKVENGYEAKEAVEFLAISKN